MYCQNAQARIAAVAGRYPRFGVLSYSSLIQILRKRTGFRWSCSTIGPRPYIGKADEFRRAEDQRVVLDQHAVVQHGDPSVRVQRTVVLEPGRRVDDVVVFHLPGFWQALTSGADCL